MGETIISVGRTGLFLRLGTAPAGLVILGMRYPQGFAVGEAHASPWAYTYAPFRGSVRIILDTSESTPPLLRLGILCSSNRPCKDPAPYDDE